MTTVLVDIQNDMLIGQTSAVLLHITYDKVQRYLYTGYNNKEQPRRFLFDECETPIYFSALQTTNAHTNIVKQIKVKTECVDNSLVLIQKILEKKWMFARSSP